MQPRQQLLGLNITCDFLLFPGEAYNLFAKSFSCFNRGKRCFLLVFILLLFFQGEVGSFRKISVKTQPQPNEMCCQNVSASFQPRQGGAYMLVSLQGMVSLF